MSAPPQQPRQPTNPQQPSDKPPSIGGCRCESSDNGAPSPGGKTQAVRNNPAQNQKQVKPQHNQRKHPNPAKQQKPAQSKGGAAASSSSSSPSVGTRPAVSILNHPSFSSLQLCDIGANLLDGMYSGCYHHSNQPKHPADLDAVLRRATQRKVSRIIVTAGSAEESEETMELLQKLSSQQASSSSSASSVPFPSLYTTVGVHPTRTSGLDGTPEHTKSHFDRLVACALRGVGVGADGKYDPSAKRTVVAIGECGMDFDRLHFSSKESQRRHFGIHLDLVKRAEGATGGKVRLPLFLHDRNTSGEFTQVLREARAQFRTGVVHSFTGSMEDLQAALELNLYIGVNGCSLKTAENIEVVRNIPLDRLLLETDAPWCEIRPTHAGYTLIHPDTHPKLLAKRPESWSVECEGVKGRNEPGAMVQVLEVVAGARNMDPVELAEQVWKNTMQVFWPDEVEQDAATKSSDNADAKVQ